MSVQIHTEDPLQLLPIERWNELEVAFEADGARGISALTALRTQRQLETRGLGYGFTVYCPYGIATNGMVAFNKKGELNEIIILCPKNDTTSLEASLVNKTIIDWNNKVLVPYMPENIIKCIQNVAERINLDIEAEDIVPNDVFILDRQEQVYGVDSLPSNVKFQAISEKDVPLIDSKWRNRYEGSEWLFRTLIKANFGYGIYKNEGLVSWVFLNEVGALTHLFTFENHRGKGYARELMKQLCNSMERNKKLIAYCRRGNTRACKLYESLGFKRFHEVRWSFLKIKC